eukprot:TRINITY_DN23565_c0_g1_i1.p1 TRINITY_DN23565_c0_g1~~TRINITY_DN23565_c0_g1_i1.p1  ORF type:complete len:418 (-),score=59.41 TRINITY_DN23565_c0_g1_i1:59-1270(-)
MAGYFGEPPDPSRPKQLFPGVSSASFDPVEASRVWHEAIISEKEGRSIHQFLGMNGQLPLKKTGDAADAVSDLKSRLGDMMPGYGNIANIYKELGWERNLWGQMCAPEMGHYKPVTASSRRPTGSGRVPGRTATGRTRASSRASSRGHTASMKPEQLKEAVASAVAGAVAKVVSRSGFEAEEQPAIQQVAQENPLQQKPPAEQQQALNLLEMQRQQRNVKTPCTRETVRAWSRIRKQAWEQPAFGAQDPSIQDCSAQDSHLHGGVFRTKATVARPASAASTRAPSSGRSATPAPVKAAHSTSRPVSATDLKPGSKGLQVQNARGRCSSAGPQRKSPSTANIAQRPSRVQSAGSGRVPARSKSSPGLKVAGSASGPCSDRHQDSNVASMIKERCGRGLSKPLLL